MSETNVASNIPSSNYTTTEMLPRIYRSQMSQTNAANNSRTTQMLPRIYRYEMS
jgi:hypothetical protein